MALASSRPTLLCCAFPFGYGPAVKLLLIARRLRAAGVHTTFLGHGISYEMAANCTDAFDEVIHAHPTDPPVARHIANAAGLFSMMDRDFSALALSQNKPVDVADSLSWMRDQLPAPFTAAQRYWVQNFASASSAAPTRATRANTVPVGPIVEPRQPTPTHQRRGLVINLGGCETPAGPEAENFAYADFVLRGILQSEVTKTFTGPSTVLAGHHAIAHLRATFPDCGIALQTVTHDAALDLLSTATHVLTSPGLTTTLECFQFAVPTYFLPPQNYSQWCIQHHLRSIGLATHTFDWSMAAATPLPLDTVPESTRTPLIRQAIFEAGALPSAIGQFAHFLHQWLAADPSSLAIRQREFFEFLGLNGVDTIAEELIRIFR